MISLMPLHLIRHHAARPQRLSGKQPQPVHNRHPALHLPQVRLTLLPQKRATSHVPRSPKGCSKEGVRVSRLHAFVFFVFSCIKQGELPGSTQTPPQPARHEGGSRRDNTHTPPTLHTYCFPPRLEAMCVASFRLIILCLDTSREWASRAP